MDKLVIQYSLICILFNLLLFIFGLDQLYIISGFIFLLNVILYFTDGLKTHRNEFKNFANPIYIIFLSLCIVNLQNCLNQFFGYLKINDIMTETYRPYLYKVFYGGEICISSFILGSVLKLKIKQSKNIKSYKEPFFLWFWVIISLLSLLLFIRNIDVSEFVAGAVYRNSGAADRVMDISNYYETILNISIIICFSIITKKNLIKNNKSLIQFITSIPIILWIVVIVYVFLRMVSGDRGPVVYTLAVIFYSYIISSRIYIKFKELIVLIFIGGSIFFILGIVRDSNLNDSFEERVVKAVSSEKRSNYDSILPATQELANSSSCNYIAIYDIDRETTYYQMGKYSFFGILAGIPGSSFILGNILDIDLRDKSVLEYITISYFGKNYTIGLGGTPFAEFYLDFGIIGVIIGSVIVGLIFRWISINITSNIYHLSINRLIIILKFASIAIYIPRFTLSGTIAAVLYIIIVYNTINYILKLIHSIINTGLKKQYICQSQKD